jgi:type VI secretion system protein ImpL
MQRIWRFFTSRWTVSFVGAALLAALMICLAILLGMPEGLLLPATICLTNLLAWGSINFILDRRHQRTDQALAAGVTALSPADETGVEEINKLKEKLTTALALLRRASGASGYLYEQPWYIIIGPPGAGKTTALLNAGLNFPLAEAMGQGAVSGVGGTRLCDWWFTDQAVLIDTSGRYTTQDSHAATDRAAWEAFLDLLRQTRPRQPLNGVLVAIGAPDLADSTTAGRLGHARNIRQRLRELRERLGMELPVYVLFTKVDLLVGFTEFFDDLERPGRAQVWGHTFSPAGAGDAVGPAARWPTALRGLVDRLNERLIDRLHAERSADRRALLAGFPAQVASLEHPLGEFLVEAFSGSRLDPAPKLRGVYFTSGTQEGPPIDRLTAALASAFGLDQRQAAILRPQQGRSYFLQGLLQLIFGEAMIATTRPGARRRRASLRIGALCLMGAFTIGFVGWVLSTRGAQHNDSVRVAAGLEQFDQLIGSMRLDPVIDGDLTAVLPVLDRARALPYGEDSSVTSQALGLSQDRKYSVATRLLYQRTLEHVLLPRLLWRLEEQMRELLGQKTLLQQPDQLETLYEATRVYLMLGGRAPTVDVSLIGEWERLDWQQQYAADPALRAGLKRHLIALLSGTLPEVTLDELLLRQAQDTIANVSLEARAYSRIPRVTDDDRVADWTPAGALDAAGLQVFYRASGKPLADGVPGFFTPRGFRDLFLKNLDEAVDGVATESWVLGRKVSLETRLLGKPTLRLAVTHRYIQEYERVWDAMLKDLQVRPIVSNANGFNTLDILASPQSPLRDMLTSISQQLALAKQNTATADSGAIGKAASGAVGQLDKLLPGLAGSAEPPAKEVEIYYKDLLIYVGSGPTSPLERTLKILGDLQQQLAAAGGAPQTGVDMAKMLRANAAFTPLPVNNWLTVIAGGSSAARAAGAKAAAKSAFAGPGGPASLCSIAVNGSYPFVRSAVDQIPIADFANLFAENGVLNTFFTAQIAPYIDSSGPVWHLRDANGISLPLTNDDLAQFQRAASIRDHFFAPRASLPSVQLFITPEDIDPGATQVTLDLGATQISYPHGLVRETPVVWPGPQGMEDVRLAFDPPPQGSVKVIEERGPWALFRLFDRGALTRGARREDYELRFVLGERSASFHLRAGTIQNPLQPGLLEGFRCPGLQ